MTEKSKDSAPLLGVDIGGTKVAVGLVDRDGKILMQGRKPMVANGTAEAALHAVTGAIDSLISSATSGDSQYRNLRPRAARSEDRCRSQSSKSAVLAQLSAGREDRVNLSSAG